MLLEDRRAAIQGLRSFAKGYPASVASGGLRALISSLRNDSDDVDTIKVVLETLLMLFAPDENSPEASDEIALWLADEFTQRQDNITTLLDLLDSREFYSRLYSLQLMSHICAARPERTQECIFTAPLGISRLASVLSDSREPVRNEALLLLIALTPSSEEIQKLVAFENVFDHIFALIEAEGSLAHGSEVVEDCLSLLANLLRLNISNQSYFRETGYIKGIAKLLADGNGELEADETIPQWALAHRDKNLWGVFAIVQLFLIRGGISTPVNQMAFWQSGVTEQVLRTAFGQNFNVKVTSKALETCADLIRGNPLLQEKFGDIEVLWGSGPPSEHAANGANEPNDIQRINVIEALLKLTLESSPIQLLDARLAACECMKAFFADHAGIRTHVLRRAIEGHLSGQDQIPNILSVLVSPPELRGNADPYQTWMASVLMLHLLFEYPEGKAMAMKVTEGDAESGEEVVTCVQAITGNLVTGMQRGDDERISIGYLMLLCSWLFEDPDVVNDFLGEGSSIQSLLQVIKQRGASNVLVPGLCTVLLGIVYEFSSKDSPISRVTLHKLLIEQLGREQYIDKIKRLRSSHWIRDYEVLPQKLGGQHDGGLPEVFFDRTFVDFLKDNFKRLICAIDRDPGLEISVVTNGIQKGISRELVDSLRSQLEDRNEILQKLESDVLALQRKFDQEALDHKKTKESTALELARIKQINEALQRNHEEELARLDELHRRAKNDLLKQHGEQLRAIDSQLKTVSADYEKNGIKARERHEAEVADLKQTIRTLESDLTSSREQHAAEVSSLKETVHTLQLAIVSAKQEHKAESTDLKNTIQNLKVSFDKANEKSVHDLQAVHEEYSAKCSTLEKRATEAESKTEGTQATLKETSETLKKVQAELERVRLEAKAKEESSKKVQAELDKVKSEVKEKEEARKTAQSELEDLLIVFGDLEAKRHQDKKRLKDLGEEVSEDEDEDEDEDDEDEEKEVD